MKTFSTNARRTKIRRPRRLRMESLEHRRVLAAWTVTSLVDNAPDTAAVEGSLRWAIEQSAISPEADTIRFDGSLNGPIDLQSQLEVLGDNDIDIIGPGSHRITINGGGMHRVLYVNEAELSLSGVTIAGGFSTNAPGVPDGMPVDPRLAVGDFSLGGGLLNVGGDVEINRVTFIGNQTGGVASAENPLGLSVVGLGGAIFNFLGGNLEVRNSRFDSNAAVGLGVAAGGAIDTDVMSTTHVSRSRFTNNQAQAILGLGDDPTTFQGGAIGGALKASGGSEMTIVGSSFHDNGAYAGDGFPGLGPAGGFIAGGGAIGSIQLSLFQGVGMVPTVTEIFASTIVDNEAIGGGGLDGFDGGGAAGGGLVNWGLSEMTVRSSRIAGNTATGGDGGAAVPAVDGVPAVVGGNGGSATGGGIDVGFSSFGIDFGVPVLNVSHSWITGNSVVGGNGGAAAAGVAGGDGGLAAGGAISNTTDYLLDLLPMQPEVATGQISIYGTWIRGNEAFGGNGVVGGNGLGGAIFNRAGLNLRISFLTGNNAIGGAGSTTAGQGLGGGIYNDAALTGVNLDFISRLLLRSNDASTDGDDSFGLF